MPRIQFVKNKAPIDIPEGIVLMEALLAHGVPVASSCKGDGICGKCRMRIVVGAEHLSTKSSAEASVLEKNLAGDHERLSCQIQVFQDLTVDTGYW
jgi:2Fe-2S ferredoxin